MTMAFHTDGSATLKVLFDNLTTEDQHKAAARDNMRGPYQVGELTAYVFRPKTPNSLPMQVASLEDTGLASGEGGRQEVDFNQCGPEDLPVRAQSWYETQLSRRAFGLHQKVAVVFDGSRSGAPELSDEAALARRLDALSTPDWTERAFAAVKKAFGKPQP